MLMFCPPLRPFNAVVASNSDTENVDWKAFPAVVIGTTPYVLFRNFFWPTIVN